MKETLNLRLSGGPSAPARARHALRSLDRSLDDLGEDVGLLVSELITNAVLHGGTRSEDAVELTACASADRVRIEVSDGGSGFDPATTPRERVVGGYGLRLVEMLSNRWGVTRSPHARVWFEIDRSSRHERLQKSVS